MGGGDNAAAQAGQPLDASTLNVYRTVSPTLATLLAAPGRLLSLRATAAPVLEEVGGVAVSPLEEIVLLL